MQLVALDVATCRWSRPTASVLAGLLIVALAATWAQAAKRNPRRMAVAAKVDRSQVVVDQEFTLLIRIDGVYDTFQDPALPGFEVVARNSRERNVLKDGVADNYREIAFRLRPLKTGQLAIGPASALVGGKVVARSKPLSVEVINPPPPGSAAQARDVSRFVDQATFLHAYSDKDSYRVGEPFVLKWDLYYRSDLLVTPGNVHTRPALGGLSSRELMTSPSQPVKVTIAGRAFYRIAYSRQMVLAPAPVEELVVDPLQINVNVEARFSKARITSNAYRVRVRSLPSENRPDWFRAGNVGRFEIEATWRYLRGDNESKPSDTIPESLVVDDFLIVDIEVRGRGNLNGISRPVLDGTQRFEVVSRTPRASNVVTFGVNGVSGVRHWRLRLRPRMVGTYAIPRIQFAFFDPAEGRYQALTVKGRMITVNQTMRAVMGGQTLQNENLRAARAEVGWPNLRVTYTIPVERDIDVSPQIAFTYGNNLRADAIGLELGAELRWQFWRDGAWSGALVPNPAVLVLVPIRKGDGELGLRFGLPAVTLGYQVTSTISLFMGGQLPLWMTLGPDPQVWLPIMADFGVEFQVHRTDDAIINLMAGISGGPSLCFNRCPGPLVELGLRGFIGGAVVW